MAVGHGVALALALGEALLELAFRFAKRLCQLRYLLGAAEEYERDGEADYELPRPDVLKECENHVYVSFLACSICGYYTILSDSPRDDV